jgi:hypothetical protein
MMRADVVADVNGAKTRVNRIQMKATNMFLPLPVANNLHLPKAVTRRAGLHMREE